MTTIEKVQIRTNPDNLVVWMSDWTRWIEFVEKGYFSTKEILINGSLIRSDTRIYLKCQRECKICGGSKKRFLCQANDGAHYDDCPDCNK